jgi:outer membrane protein TolC
MKFGYLLSHCSKMAVLLAVLGRSPEVFATQPLETFIQAARTTGFDAREQTALIEQRKWEKQAALGRLTPALSARGVYTRNQYEAEIPAGPVSPVDITITPRNQLDALFQLDVPLIDLANYYRYGQARHLVNAAEAQRELSQSDSDRVVARAYYTFVGAAALVDAAERSLKSAEENLAYVSTRFAAGVVSELDRERAVANVERAKQERADAEFVRTMSARNLETASGITPTPVTEYPLDDLRPEAPLAEWLRGRHTPADRLQVHLGRAASSAKKAAASALLPTLSANAQERISNATGFSGHSSAYTLQAVLSWRADYGVYATAEAQASAADVQQVRAERSRRGTEDGIFDAHERVRTGIAKSASARAQSAAASRAEALALARYQAGALTQLDVTQAQRDSFQAQAARIQADADLAYARVLLRVMAGKPPQVPASASSSLPVSPPPSAPASGSPAPPAPSLTPSLPAP